MAVAIGLTGTRLCSVSARDRIGARRGVGWHSVHCRDHSGMSVETITELALFRSPLASFADNTHHRCSQRERSRQARD